MAQPAGRYSHAMWTKVREHVAAARVKHLDETGFRIGGRTQWLHIFSTALLTFYRVSSKRGSLLSGVTGIVVHDHWKPSSSPQTGSFGVLDCSNAGSISMV